MKKNILVAIFIFSIELVIRGLFYLTVNHTINDNYFTYQNLMLPFIFILDIAGLGLFPSMSYFTATNSNHLSPKKGYLLFLGFIFMIIYLSICSINSISISIIVLSLSFLIMPYLQCLRGYFQGMGKFHIPVISIIIEMIIRIIIYFIGFYIKKDMIITAAVANTTSYYASLIFLKIKERSQDKLDIKNIINHGLKILPISTITSSINFFDSIALNIVGVPSRMSGMYLFKVLRLVGMPIYFSRTLASIFLVSSSKEKSKIYPLVVIICVIYVIISYPLMMLYEGLYHEKVSVFIFIMAMISSLCNSLIKILSSNLYNNRKIKGLSIGFLIMTVVFIILSIILTSSHHVTGLAIANFITTFTLLLITLFCYYKLNIKNVK